MYFLRRRMYDASSLMDRYTTISANLASPHMQPPRVVSSRWRERSPQTLHRATFA